MDNQQPAEEWINLIYPRSFLSQCYYAGKNKSDDSVIDRAGEELENKISSLLSQARQQAVEECLGCKEMENEHEVHEWQTLTPQHIRNNFRKRIRQRLTQLKNEKRT